MTALAAAKAAYFFMLLLPAGRKNENSFDPYLDDPGFIIPGPDLDDVPPDPGQLMDDLVQVISFGSQGGLILLRDGLKSQVGQGPGDVEREYRLSLPLDDDGNPQGFRLSPLFMVFNVPQGVRRYP